jgi:HEAT repeat protein
MRDENPRVRFDAVHALGFVAEAPLTGATARLLGAELDHYDPIIRAATARVLARLQARDALDLVAVAVNDSNATVRLYATEALGLLRDTKAAVELRSQLPRARGDLLEATVLALARLGQREDVEFFRARTIDRAEGFRRAAVEGLGRAGEADAADLLANALKSDRSDVVRTAAAFVMLAPVAAQARDYLLEIGRPALPAVQATLAIAKDGRHRADLLQIIGYIGAPDDAAILQPFAADKDERVRRAATAALQRLKR